jgi:hypothetical protein
MALLMATMIVVLGCEVGGEYTEYTTELMVIPKVLGKELMVIPKEHSNPPEINEYEKQYKRFIASALRSTTWSIVISSHRSLKPNTKSTLQNFVSCFLFSPTSGIMLATGTS